VEELDDVYAGDAPITYQSLREITLTEYAVKEALRLHPPLFMLVRVVMEDFEYKGYHLPAGTWLLISPTVAHRIVGGPFRDPLAFDPDRYAPPREEDKIDYAYIPFGGGRHKCMGNAFALLQVKAILAVLLRHYEFELAGDPIGEDFHGLVVGPTEPCRLRYRRRSSVKARVNGNGVNGKATAKANGNGVSHAAAEPVLEARPFRVSIDSDLCQGHAVCIEETPELFAIGDNGKVKLLQTEPPPALYASASLAAKYCPTRTIKIIAEEQG
jgi:sterol 14-demethylase